MTTPIGPTLGTKKNTATAATAVSTNPTASINEEDIADENKHGDDGESYAVADIADIADNDNENDDYDSARADVLEPFRGIQGMGPAVLTSLLQFARAESNREVVEALASELRFVRPARRRRRRGRRLLEGRGGGENGGDKNGEAGGVGGGGGKGAWVEGKTVVFTGSLTR